MSEVATEPRVLPDPPRPSQSLPPFVPRRRRRNVSVYTEVDVDLADIDTEDLVEELRDRPDGAAVFPPVAEAGSRIERLYYATRGDSFPPHVIAELRDLIADLYGRAA
jgi:hypothetical protein